MDIMRMHDMIEKLSECAKCEIDKGIENIDPCEMGQVTDMMKDLAEAMYYRTLMKAMEESSADETIRANSNQHGSCGNGRKDTRKHVTRYQKVL